MADIAIRPSSEVEPVSLPLTAVCIVGDKSRTPKGFVPVAKCFDDSSDADLWRDGVFTFQRQVRYLCVSRELPDSNIRAPISVITDMTIVKESDPIPHGFIALDYTADSREKSLRKKYICIKSEHRDRVVDAIGDVIVTTSKCKKTPKDYTHAGEVDGLNIYFKAISIPPTYNLTHSSSASQINRNPSTLYPGLPTTSTANSVPSDMNAARVDVFTMKNPMIQKMKGVDGVPFKLNSQLEASLGKKQVDPLPPLANFDIRRLDSDEFAYSFTLEKATLAN